MYAATSPAPSVVCHSDHAERTRELVLQLSTPRALAKPAGPAPSNAAGHGFTIVPTSAIASPFAGTIPSRTCGTERADEVLTDLAEYCTRVSNWRPCRPSA